MPHIALTIGNEGDPKATNYKKYIQPNEFNVFVQNRFEDWQGFVKEYFKS